MYDSQPVKIISSSKQTAKSDVKFNNQENIFQFITQKILSCCFRIHDNKSSSQDALMYEKGSIFRLELLSHRWHFNSSILSGSFTQTSQKYYDIVAVCLRFGCQAQHPTLPAKTNVYIYFLFWIGYIHMIFPYNKGSTTASPRGVLLTWRKRRWCSDGFFFAISHRIMMGLRHHSPCNKLPKWISFLFRFRSEEKLATINQHHLWKKTREQTFYDF